MKINETLIDPYEKIATRYDRYVEPFLSVIRKIGLKMYPPKQGMRVLDVGCGTGTNLGLYHKHGCHLFGIDLSRSMVEAAQKKLGDRAEIRLGDMSNMPYPNGSFDLVTGFFTLHEMPSSIRPAAIREIVRVVKRNGRILLVDYSPGPIRFPKGWIYRAVILLFEILAGREHFRNYRDFLSRNGLSFLIGSQRLKIETKKIISGSNIALILLNKE